MICMVNIAQYLENKKLETEIFALMKEGLRKDRFLRLQKLHPSRDE